MKFDFDGVDFTQVLQLAEDLQTALSDIQLRLDFLETRIICLEDQAFKASFYVSEE